MGRHRRSAPPVPEAPGAAHGDAPTAARTGTPAAARRRGGHRAALGRGTAPVRAGLLGASAAVAMGAVAAASGLIPGHGQFDGGTGGDPGDRVRADALPEATAPLGGGSPSPSDRATNEASRGGSRPTAPDTGRPSSPTTPSASPAPHQPSTSPTGKTGSHRPSRPAGRPSAATPERSAAPSKTPDARSSAEAQVLSLVNQERGRAGCSPVTADGELAHLAQQFSDDMAGRGFFGHTDPDGDTPWDRARAADISGLGGENIARGQANAQSVMDSWMSSPGHRANILNCEYKTLGVGAHFGPGGPWWTQDFGF
ncbi:CAP domain-containing protein [Streptomyces sp. ISID311]|uniref:CAP domain-containing protein n=1 Tax=Streptomyces sp. ISID311 TaxID=2601673 RepID=UPI0021C4902C|nr:CAP domain-containing protein [Streptomyces sp. ISID311]